MLHPIGIVGFGIMGSAIAGSLIKAGYRVIGFDVRAGRVRILELRGPMMVSRDTAAVCAVLEKMAGVRRR